MRIFLMISTLMVLVFASTFGAVPRLINYQGRLTDAAGQPLTGAYVVTLRIYDSPTGGTMLWSETYGSLNITEGLFGVMLGSVTSLPDSVFQDTVLYLATKVGGDDEMLPRQRISSVPFALKASIADSALSSGYWSSDGTNIYRTNGRVGIGTATPTTNLDIAGYARIGKIGFIPNYPEVMFNGYHNGLSAVYGSDGNAFSISHDMPNHRLNFKFAPDGIAGNPISFDRAMVIDSAGKVGIGTTNPTSLLTVAGGIASDLSDGSPLFALRQGGVLRFTNYLSNGEEWRVARYDDGGSYLNSPLRVHRSTGDIDLDYSTLYVDATNNFVGVGVASPAAKLHISSGDVLFHSGDNPYTTMGRIRFGTSYSGWSYWAGIEGSTEGGLDQACLKFITCFGGGGYGTREQMRITPIGDVGIGTTNPAYKLHVIGSFCATGAKMAIVPTSQGMTELYCEESSEVWFTDYGKARIENGRCHVDLDPLFLETVTIDGENPMMVFLQEEGECNGLYVQTGPTGFDVIERGDGDSDVAFSYRLVAKRKGHEGSRLETESQAEGGAK